MTLLLFEPKLCTLQELQTVYSVEDFYDLLEIVDVQRALKEEADRQRNLKKDKR